MGCSTAPENKGDSSGLLVVSAAIFVFAVTAQ
jgi:hypothetical protein